MTLSPPPAPNQAAPPGGGPLRLDVFNLSVKRGRRCVLEGVFFSVLPGEAWAILGASGGGKSTLLQALAGWLPWAEGQVLFDGQAASALPVGRLGYVPQDDIVHTSLRVEDALRYGALLRWQNIYPQESLATLKSLAKSSVDRVLEQVELESQRRCRIASLSGGQRKRVNWAMELLTNPGILFLDEPTSGLDPALEGRMTRLFQRASRRGCSVLLTTHSTQSLLTLDMVLMLAAGRVVWCGPPREMLTWFKVDQFADIYELLEEPQAKWAERFVSSNYHYLYVQKRLEQII